MNYLQKHNKNQMSKILINLIYCLVLAITFTSCGINSNVMLKSPKGAEYTYDSIPMRPKDEYRISKDDKLMFLISTGFGQEIIDGQVGLSQKGSTFGIEYTVKQAGTVDLPIHGSLYVEGMTITQCEDTLKKIYSKQYKEPYVQVKVTNQRVIIFNGTGSDGKVYFLKNANTTLLEAIIETGGIDNRGKAKSIKLIRKENSKRKIYEIDLSKIDGLPYTDLILQSNDYIYVEAKPSFANGFLREATPIIGLFTSSLLILNFLKL